MSDKRAVLSVEKAVRALPEKQKLLTFIPLSNGGRRFAVRSREEIINRMLECGGADATGRKALEQGFGLAIPIEAPAPALIVWLFIETVFNLCPFCLGSHWVRNEHELEVVGEQCWVCEGKDVVSGPLPKRPTVQ